MKSVEYRTLRPKERQRIKCDATLESTINHCNEPAIISVAHHWEVPTRSITKGLSFYYRCDNHPFESATRV